MKLIELLVQELPKHGGWPDGAVECCRHHDVNSIDFYDEGGNWPTDCSIQYGKHFAKDAIYESTHLYHQSVTREQYEAALAKTEWNGEGLPPVGVDVEYKFPKVNYRNDFSRGKVLAYGNRQVFIEHCSSKNEFIQPLDNIEFRPIRSEADKKRDEVVESLAVIFGRNEQDGPLSIVNAVYEAIATGKIPGVKLSD